MQLHSVVPLETEFGSFAADDRLPLIRLRELRRELVLSLQGDARAVTRERIREIAEVQQAIKAIEAVIAE
jgi:hypothetical protein